MTLTPLQRNDFATIYDYLHVEFVMPENADAIIVGGSGSRTDMVARAVQLFHDGIAPCLVLSGFAHPEFGINESMLMKEYALDHGVPESAIITESLATNTGLNIVLSAQKLQALGVEVKRIILVHKPFMTRRFLATAQAQWPEPRPEFFVTSSEYSFDEYMELERARGLHERTLKTLLKDYVVIKEFPARGFITPQPIDMDAEAAYNRLVTQGFMSSEQNEALSTEKFQQAGS